MNEQGDSFRIFGLGLSRTATTSLHLALLALGMSAIHYPGQRTLPWLYGVYSPRTTSQFEAFTDLPTPVYFRRLHETHPDAKFIYTRRDPGKWLDSCEQHFVHDTPLPSQFTILRDYIRLATYGTMGFDRARFEEVFHEHDERVRAHFANHPDQLLTLDLDAGDLDWQRLVDFLHAEHPGAEVPFPHWRSPQLGRLQAITRDRRKQVQAQVLAQLRQQAAP